jgi:hypothetical protein
VREDIIEEMNRDEFIKVEEERYIKMQENLEYYKTAIQLIKDEMYGLAGLEHDYTESMKEIGSIIEELELELNTL